MLKSANIYIEKYLFSNEMKIILNKRKVFIMKDYSKVSKFLEIPREVI